ncbi:glycosyltransferase family 25 protein [Zoogloea sp.]|uniref:glycosyltransferase family 25 protein n=1 Tax=Zoogloea sp. TaxID=49181 RepID=UPI0031FD834D
MTPDAPVSTWFLAVLRAAMPAVPVIGINLAIIPRFGRRGGTAVGRVFMHIFVINLERDGARRAQILSHLKGLGLDAEVLPAVEGAKLPPEALPAGTHPGLSGGEIGCYLSHVRFWETVVERGLPHAIVLEDDVHCRPDMLNVAEEAIATGLPFDALRLSALRPIHGKLLATLSNGVRLVLPTKNPSGTQGYLVSLEGARRLLEQLSVPRCPIDNALDLYWKYGLRIPLVSPSVVEEDASLASTIVGRYGMNERKTVFRHLARVARAERRKWTVFFMARRLKASLRAAGRGRGVS